MWLGLNEQGIGAVAFMEEFDGPGDIFLKLTGVELRHRNQGGGKAWGVPNHPDGLWPKAGDEGSIYLAGVWYPRRTSIRRPAFWAGVVAEPEEVSVMPADDDAGLVDESLRQEIDLLGDLMAAVADATDHLPEPQIDEVLGTRARPPS
jgi:hypothetical protein